MPPLPAGNARAAAALSTEGAATAGTGEAAAAASGAEGPAPADGAGAGAAGVAVSSTATWPESTSSQLTWTGDGDPAESTARTTPFPADGGAVGQGEVDANGGDLVDLPGPAAGGDGVGRHVRRLRNGGHERPDGVPVGFALGRPLEPVPPPALRRGAPGLRRRPGRCDR